MSSENISAEKANSNTDAPTSIDSTPTSKPASSPPFKHPLDPLTEDEIINASVEIRRYLLANTEVKAVKFITLSLLPTTKRAVLAYLGIPIVPGSKPEKPVPIIRRAESDFLDVVHGRAYNAELLLNPEGKWEVDVMTLLPEEFHPQISVEELTECEVVVRNSPLIQKIAKDAGLEPEQIYCDGWAIGYDERFPQAQRVQQALMFARFSEHDNIYAHPLDFVPVVDVTNNEVLYVDFPPHYVRNPDGSASLTVHSTAPPPIAADSLAASKRERVPPPRKAWDFLPDLMAKTEEGGYEPRKDVKPLHVVQPEGVSFKIDGHVLEWQNWKMHIGPTGYLTISQQAFSQREGIALSTITYNDKGEIRPIMYRLSMAEMVVPYGAPEYPHPRKFAFDSGEYGMGTMANELSLGCDCLGQIHYMPGVFVSHSGNPFVIKNVICIHEEDSGVLWKHSDYRPGGRSHTVRRRRLVISMVCTLANYEYVWNYHFYQDGSIEFEIRLTGILSVYVHKDGEPSPFGTVVAPNINAQHHQHLFSLRVDPMVDGLNNSIVETDIIPLDAPTGSKENFAGNAFFTKDSILKKECGRPFDYAKDRRWKIVNASKKHYTSGKEVGYSIGLKGGATPMMSRPDGWAARRAKFISNTLWVCRDVEAQNSGSLRMWPAGKYVPQTREEPEDSIGSWVERGLDVENQDLLVYLTVGTTHIARPEDWPVMPVETLHVTFKPNSFFKANPSMDVPGSKDPLSVPAFDAGNNNAPTTNACCQ
ncbi:peroxisomal copper amine oxidase [Panaeolus papilionaceus]|nr:peroxisomal copper amine oxidase [Panaeolus papilionaceus]